MPDAATPPSLDAGRDAGTPDGGSPDGGTPDAGPPVFGGPGPWPMTNVQYGPADGILELPVVGMSTDETQNLWIATHTALYLLKPGEKTFRRFDAKDGLHLQSNPVPYCDSNFADGDRACPIFGAAVDPGISEIVGGGPNEVIVGYHGHDEGTGEWDDPNRHTGMLDRVRLKPGGSLQVDRLQMTLTLSAQYWHNRTVQRLVYDHFKHPHELYVGTNHGIDRMMPDRFREPRPGEWFLASTHDWMADHLHPQACKGAPCVGEGTEQHYLILGDWRGLAIAPDGDLWVAGRWAAGKIAYTKENYTPDFRGWADRGGAAYSKAFGDPYYGNCEGSRPVFCVGLEGDPVALSAVTATPDGLAWFSSGPYDYHAPNPPNAGDKDYGVASYDGRGFTYYHPVRDIGMAETNVRDMVALPDGRIVFAGPSTGLVLWDPRTLAHTTVRAGQDIPDDRVLRLELDTMVSPPVLHVSTWGGAASLRVLPR